MPLYAMLPAFNEFAIEKGWTRTYSRFVWMRIGSGMYLTWFVDERLVVVPVPGSGQILWGATH